MSTISIDGWRREGSVAGRRHPRLLAISTNSSIGGRAFDKWVEALATHGVDSLLIREKSAADRSVLELVLRARDLAAGRLSVLVSGRCDLAVAAGADGVHLPSSGIPLHAARQIVGPGAIIGRSTHHPEEVESALVSGADYVLFGPVFDTPSKRAFGPPVGLDGLSRAASTGGSIVAVGGITMGRLRSCAEAGATGVASIRMFQSTEDLASIVALAETTFTS